MTKMTVDIPLLRKGLEWAEAEAAKPLENCEWHQSRWRSDPRELSRVIHFDDNGEMVVVEVTKSPDCGTCFCLAGYLMTEAGIEFNDNGFDNETKGAELLGITLSQASRLFAGGNTIGDLRTIAEEIAGERL